MGGGNNPSVNLNDLANTARRDDTVRPRSRARGNEGEEGEERGGQEWRGETKGGVHRGEKTLYRLPYENLHKVE